MPVLLLSSAAVFAHGRRLRPSPANSNGGSFTADKVLSSGDVAACKTACQEDVDCTFWSFHAKRSKCSLTSTGGFLKQKRGAPPPSTRAEPELTLSSPDTRGLRLERTLL